MTSGANPTHVKLYLSFYDASGYQSRLEQLRAGSVTSPICHFLADEETDEPLFVIGHRDSLHSHACLSMLEKVSTTSDLPLTIHYRCV
jgi:hypothetical protein